MGQGVDDCGSQLNHFFEPHFLQCNNKFYCDAHGHLYRTSHRIQSLISSRSGMKSFQYLNLFACYLFIIASVLADDSVIARGLIGINLFTWTVTSTSTVTYTCTTSTSALKSCTGVYLRKREISLGRRRLLYDQDEGSTFLPLPDEK